MLREIRIAAGSSPVEGNLSAIAIAGILHEDTNGFRVLDLRIDNMDVSLGFSTEDSGPPRGDRPKKQELSVGYVLLHTSGTSTEVSLSSAVVEPLCPQSLEFWSPSSSFAATLQLGQALLYELDGLHRSETNTLWMKRTSIKVTAALPCFDGAQPIHTRLENIRRYTKADGDWRRADVVGLVANMEIICSVTHRLPARLKSQKKYV